LKKKLSVLYNLPVESIAITFDGSKLDDDDNAESTELEEDDLIDVKVSSPVPQQQVGDCFHTACTLHQSQIDKSLIPAAIEHAKKLGN
jgi:hypothetical protein